VNKNLIVETTWNLQILLGGLTHRITLMFLSGLTLPKNSRKEVGKWSQTKSPGYQVGKER